MSENNWSYKNCENFKLSKDFGFNVKNLGRKLAEKLGFITGGICVYLTSKEKCEDF